jgi:hypothetical protein
MTIRRSEALELAYRHGFPLSVDFHTLRSEQVDKVLAAADERKYRKPTNANGSRARYFHAYLSRAAARSQFGTTKDGKPAIVIGD